MQLTSYGLVVDAGIDAARSSYAKQESRSGRQSICRMDSQAAAVSMPRRRSNARNVRLYCSFLSFFFSQFE